MGFFKTIIKQSIKNARENELRQQRNQLIINNKQKLKEAIDKEINRFLILKNNKNYVFVNDDLLEEMKQSLIPLMIDLRNNLYKFKATYINKSPKTIKDINNVISYYYKLDKKGKVYDIDLKEENNIAYIEHKETE